MPWTIPDHEASAVEAISRGVISGKTADLANVPEPQQSAEHQARVSALSVLNELGGVHRIVATRWTPDLWQPPVGNVVVIPAGIHSGYTIEPDSGVHYFGEPGAVLDGNGDTAHAFHGSASSVTVEGLEIRNYTNPAQTGAVHLDGGDGNRVARCDIHDNWGTGIRLRGDRAHIADCHVHRQHQLGVSIDGADGIVEDCQIGFNNWMQDFEWGWEAGGSKFWETTRLILRRNHVHDNFGPGLWCDHGNAGTLYEDNTIVDNAAAGVFHEISYDCVVRGNTIRGNGSDHAAWLWGAGVQIANAGFATIHDNLVEGNFSGIAFTDQGRGYGPLSGDVYRNTLVDSGITGTASDQASDPAGPFDFHDNTYEGGSFAHRGSEIGFDEWVGYFPGDAP